MSLFSKKEEKKEEVKVEVKATPVVEAKPENKAAEKEVKPEAKAVKPEAKVEKPVTAPVANPMENEKYVDETGYIAKGTKIEGNIKTPGNLILDGTVTGDATVKGDLVLHGSAGGNVQCDNLIINEATCKSVINVVNNVIVDEGAVFTGKIFCKNITVYGKVDGDIVAKEVTILKKTAVVKGTITTARIGIEPGAVINGNVKIK